MYAIFHIDFDRIQKADKHVTLVMAEVNPADTIVGQIRKKLNMVNNALRTLPGGIQPLSISAGAAFSETGFSETLYQQADQALYNVKASGKRGCKIFGE